MLTLPASLTELLPPRSTDLLAPPIVSSVLVSTEDGRARHVVVTAHPGHDGITRYSTADYAHPTGDEDPSGALTNLTVFGTVEQAIGEMLARVDVQRVVRIPYGEFNEGWVCVCGNTVGTGGFYACLADGTQVEPDIDGPWGKDGRHLYACSLCPAIVDPDTNRQEPDGSWTVALFHAPQRAVKVGGGA